MKARKALSKPRRRCCRWLIDEKDGSTPTAETCMIVKLALGSLRFEGPVDLDVLRTLVQALSTR